MEVTRIVAAFREGVREGDAGTVCNTVFLRNKCGKCYIILSTFTNVEIGHQQSAPNIFNSKTRPGVLWVPWPLPFPHSSASCPGSTLGGGLSRAHIWSPVPGQLELWAHAREQQTNSEQMRKSTAPSRLGFPTTPYALRRQEQHHFTSDSVPWRPSSFAPAPVSPPSPTQKPLLQLVQIFCRTIGVKQCQLFSNSG